MTFAIRASSTRASPSGSLAGTNGGSNLNMESYLGNFCTSCRLVFMAINSYTCRHTSKEDAKVLNSALVADCKFSVSVGSKRPHVFDITTDKKTFYVQCDSEVMMNHWLGVLNDAQFHFRQQAAEAEAAAMQAAAPTMIGIGVVLKADAANGLFSVERLVEGGPADKSQKFQIGDFVVEVDGHDTSGESFDTVLSWIRGELGTFVTIVVARCTDLELMEQTATPDNPFGDSADCISIELRRDVVKKIDIYSQYSSDPAPAAPAGAPVALKSAPSVHAKPDPGAAGPAQASHRLTVSAPSFVFEGSLGKSKGTGLMGMMGYQDRYFTLDSTHLTWRVCSAAASASPSTSLVVRTRYDEKDFMQKSTRASALGSLAISELKGCVFED